MHKDYVEPKFYWFRCILIWIWRIWCMTNKYGISEGWPSYFLCSFTEVPKAYCNILRAINVNYDWYCWACSINLGRNFFRKRWKLQRCKIGLHLFCFYRFSAIFIYCVPLTLMIKHHRVSNYLRQYKSHVIVA
jgi:hypothetical protein